MQTYSHQNRIISFIHLNWGIILIFILWGFWVVVNDFNPIVIPSPFGVIKDLIQNNTQPKRAKDENNEDREETSALGSLGLKPKPAL